MTRRTLALTAAALAAAAFLASPAPGRAELVLNAGGEYRLNPVSWRDMPFRTVVRQQYDYSCGSAALATLLRYHLGRPVTETDLFTAMYAEGDQAKIRQAGFSLLDMKHYAEARGLTANGYRLTFDELARAGEPAIVVIDLGRYRHFVVVKGVRGGMVLVGDPARGLTAYPRAAFEKVWNGVAFFVRDPHGPAARFNAGADWDLRPSAPLDARLGATTPGILTRNLPSLYQISPVINASTGP